MKTLFGASRSHIKTLFLQEKTEGREKFGQSEIDRAELKYFDWHRRAVGGFSRNLHLKFIPI